MTASSITRTAINTASSGIDYKSNGSIGWSNDKFRAGIKSGAVNGAISYGLSSFNVGGDGRLGAGLRAGITSFANSTLDFNEDGWKIGIRNDNNWGDRFAAGIAAGAASAATYRASGKEESDKTNNTGTGKTEFAGGITTDEYLGHLAYNSINSGLLSMYNMKRYDMSWSQASTTTGFYSGMSYSVSELGGFAGQVLSEGTGRAEIGRQKAEEAKKKAEAEAAKNKSGQNVPPVSAAEGFINALGAGLIRIKNDLSDLWNGLKGIGESVGNLVSGKGFNTDAELEQMEINKQIAVAAAMGEYSKTKSKDMADQILADFWKDSREVTDAKRQVMVDANLDTTELDKGLSSMRQQDAELKAQAKADSQNVDAERDILMEALDYSAKYNQGKLLIAKDKTKDLLVVTAERDDTYEGLPEWVQTEKQRDLFLREIEKGNVELLDQIGDAYINSIYGVQPDGKINPKSLYGNPDSIYDWHVYQLPQGVGPKDKENEWYKIDEDYIKNLAGNEESINGGYNVDHIHFKYDGKIHYDPNNPNKRPIKHIWDDFLRKKTKGIRSDEIK